MVDHTEFPQELSHLQQILEKELINTVFPPTAILCLNTLCEILNKVFFFSPSLLLTSSTPHLGRTQHDVALWHPEAELGCGSPPVGL